MDLEPVPRRIGLSWKYTLDGMPGHQRALYTHSFTPMDMYYSQFTYLHVFEMVLGNLQYKKAASSNHSL